ncbi:MAG: sulfotransferase family 2 domain-containing protein [Bacteroidales bacterium]
MIISHQHKFIFIKPTKVAGTSIEVALAKHCVEGDIVTSISKYSDAFDDDRYTHQSQNEEDFYNHITPDEVKCMVDTDVWNSYFKFTVVRNPWDQVVSRFCWEKSFIVFKIKRNISKIKENPFKLELYSRLTIRLLELVRLRSFSNFLKNFNKEWTNTRFYFDINGNAICDYYIRYENLQSDFDSVCSRLKINSERLLRLKSKTRNHTLHYSSYYNDRDRALVADLFKKEIEYFGYEF